MGGLVSVTRHRSVFYSRYSGFPHPFYTGRHPMSGISLSIALNMQQAKKSVLPKMENDDRDLFHKL